MRTVFHMWAPFSPIMLWITILYYVVLNGKCGAHLEFLLDQDEDLLYKIYVHLTTCMTPVCIMIVYYFHLGFQILNCRHGIESPTSSTYSDSSVDMVQCPGCWHDRHIFDRLNLCSSLARYTWGDSVQLRWSWHTEVGGDNSQNVPSSFYPTLSTDIGS